jgi:GT2 family glycosyltransferase
MNYWLMSAFYSKKIEKDTSVPFLHAISLAKADVCRKLKFDESFFAREETDFYLRAVGQGLKVVLCPHTFCVHLPRDKGKGGGWRVGVLRYQSLATKNNNALVDRHYKTLKSWGMKGNKLTFKFLHLLNRVRIVYKYFRDSVDCKNTQIKRAV